MEDLHDEIWRKKEKQNLKKAQKKQRKIDKKIQNKRDYLNREIKYCETTVRKFIRNWKQQLIDISLVNMIENCQFACFRFERIVDLKDFIISALLDELDDAEQQYCMSLTMNFESTDKLILIFFESLQKLHEDYHQQVKILQLNHITLFQATIDTKDRQEEILKTRIYRLGIENKIYFRGKVAEYTAKVHETYERSTEKVEGFEESLHKKYARMWIKYKNTLESYIKSTAVTKKKIEGIKRDDSTLIRLGQIARLGGIAKKLGNKLAMLDEMGRLLLHGLESERSFIEKSILTLKTNLIKETKVDKTKKAVMVAEFYKSIDYLEQFAKKGKKMVVLYQVSRKLERIKEKVLPYPGITKNDVTDKKEPMSEFSLFFRKIDTANVTRFALAEEKEFLLLHNRHLKKKIAQACQCFECPSLPPIRKKNTISKTDGVCVMKNYAKQFGTEKGR